MRLPWLSMFLSALFLPLLSLAERRVGATRASSTYEYRHLTHKHADGEVRGYEVVIDHERREIRIRTYFFAALDDTLAQTQLDGILSYWQSQNGKFGYRLGKGTDSLTYEIVFDVQVAPGTYLENGFFVPSPTIDHALINQIQVVEAGHMPESCRDHVHVVGYSPENFIYIADDHADHLWIGIHEAGHRLGAGHQPGLMAANLIQRRDHLSKRSVREILSSADIWGRYPLRKGPLVHQVRPHTVSHIGAPPQGFFLGGKVKRLKSSK